MFDPALAPFTIALIVMAVIGALEVAGMLFGAAPSTLIEQALPDLDALEADAPEAPHAPAGAFSQMLSWLCVGRVPVLVLFVVFLTAFGAAGLALQGLVKAVLGFYLPGLIAMAPAIALALPATRAAGLGLAKIMPREESEAVSDEVFIGKVATIIRGEAKRGLPAEAKLKDLHGQTHYILVEPDGESDVYANGAEVLIVQKVGAIYRAIPNEHPSLQSSAKAEG